MVHDLSFVVGVKFKTSVAIVGFKTRVRVFWFIELYLPTISWGCNRFNILLVSKMLTEWRLLRIGPTVIPPFWQIYCLRRFGLYQGSDRWGVFSWHLHAFVENWLFFIDLTQHCSCFRESSKFFYLNVICFTLHAIKFTWEIIAFYLAYSLLSCLSSDQMRWWVLNVNFLNGYCDGQNICHLYLKIYRIIKC